MNPIKVMLADDHKLVRGGIRALVNKISGVVVVAEADDGREALELAGVHKPDVIMMDIAMSGMNGLEATIRLTKEHPNIQVDYPIDAYQRRVCAASLTVRAKGYLLKDADIAELELALQAVYQGETYLSPRISKHVIAEYVRRVGAEMERSDEPTPIQTARSLDAAATRDLAIAIRGKQNTGNCQAVEHQCENCRDAPHSING